MSRIKPILALFLCLVMASPIVAQTPEIKAPNKNGFFYRFTKNYQPTTVPMIAATARAT